MALHDPQLAPTFKTLRDHPDGFILANIGAGHDQHAAEKAISMLDADALEIHVNAAQEVIMPEGDRDFLWQENPYHCSNCFGSGCGCRKSVTASSAKICKPCSDGIHYVDIGGRGGTNFAVIENARRPPRLFLPPDWGQTTVESLLEARGLPLTILATGGIDRRWMSLRHNAWGRMRWASVDWCCTT